jgi:hypothetical protein
VLARNSRAPESFFEDDTDEVHDEVDVTSRYPHERRGVVYECAVNPV